MQPFIKRNYRSKYGSTKTIVDNIKFDSKKEAAYYSQLLLLKKGKVVKDFDLQHRFTLQDSFVYKGKTVRKIQYIADFVVNYADGHQEVVDVKGFKTKEYLLKRKMLLYKFPNIDFVEI